MKTEGIPRVKVGMLEKDSVFYNSDVDEGSRQVM